jgi:hypothetical protein
MCIKEGRSIKLFLEFLVFIHLITMLIEAVYSLIWLPHPGCPHGFTSRRHLHTHENEARGIQEVFLYGF